METGPDRTEPLGDRDDWPSRSHGSTTADLLTGNVWCPRCGGKVTTRDLAAIPGPPDGEVLIFRHRCGQMWPRFTEPDRRHEVAEAVIYVLEQTSRSTTSDTDCIDPEHWFDCLVGGVHDGGIPGSRPTPCRQKESVR